MNATLMEFIPQLRCPVTHARLKEMRADKLQDLNQRIAAGELFHYNGSPVKEPVSQALITENETLVYPVIDGAIVVLLETLAIDCQCGQQILPERKKLAGGKETVLSFYEEYGWKKADNNMYHDTIDFEDRRSVAENYWDRCNSRLNKYFSQKGKYFLDVASGAISHPEYLHYSDNFEVRICMDFSLLALKEAQQKIGERGFCILGDVTNIPFESNCMDAVVSLHTIYHVPMEEQTKAIGEIYRVLKPDSLGVVVYSWKSPLLMQAVRSTVRTMVKVLSPLRKGRKKASGREDAKRPELFVQQQNPDWFIADIKERYNARLSVFSSISRSFSNMFIKEKYMGTQVARFIYGMENLFPAVLGRYGQYPVFLLRKPRQQGTATSKRTEQVKAELNA